MTVSYTHLFSLVHQIDSIIISLFHTRRLRDCNTTLCSFISTWLISAKMCIRDREISLINSKRGLATASPQDERDISVDLVNNEANHLDVYKRHMQKLSLSLVGHNLLLITPKHQNYIDPESSNCGNDISSEFGETMGSVSTRNYGINLKVVF